MLARLQRLVVYSLLLSAIWWVAYFLSQGSALWAGGGLLVIPFGYAAVMGVEFLLLRRSTVNSRKASFGQLSSAWWQELITAPQVFLWRQPFRSAAVPDSVAPAALGQRGVVLVHGFVCNRGIWNPWMSCLREKDVRFIAVTLEPVFGSIDDYVSQIDDAVCRVQAATGMAPVLVAHSMGGLAVRAWLAGIGSVERLRHVVTIGTPHCGTAMARHGHTTNSRQMRIGSPWLKQLARTENSAAYGSFTCFWSHCDNIVFPARSATLAGADNRHLEATPHVKMVYHGEVLAEVLRLIGES